MARFTDGLFTLLSLPAMASFPLVFPAFALSIFNAGHGAWNILGKTSHRPFPA